MKRCLLFLLAVATVFCLSSCSEDVIQAGNRPQSNTTTTVTEPVRPDSSTVQSSGQESDSSTSTSSSTTTTKPTEPMLPDSQFDEVTGVQYENMNLAGKTAVNFELPLEGATGFASIKMLAYASPDKGSQQVMMLAPGDAFTILEEKDGKWWYISRSGQSGWVDNTCCYLNIPDVVPSIIFDNTNAYSSVFVSSGKAIPGITDNILYESLCYNGRFGEDRFVVAANYIMVKKIYAAQQAALAEGYTLIINETFRPFDVQLNVAAQLKKLYQADAEVKAGINIKPWSMGWFIASTLSTHQKGCAMDVTLAKVSTIRYELAGGYKYPTVTEYKECSMPTPIHELSAAAVSLTKPVNSYSPTAWKIVAPAATMTEDALRLKRFCTQAGMSPLASEWWHFNDLEAKDAIGNNFTSDVFYINTCFSKIPE